MRIVVVVVVVVGCIRLDRLQASDFSAPTSSSIPAPLEWQRNPSRSRAAAITAAAGVLSFLE